MSEKIADIYFNGKQYNQKTVISGGSQGPIIDVDYSKVSLDGELKVIYDAGEILEFDLPIVFEYNNQYYVIHGKEKLTGQNFKARLLTKPRLKKAMYREMEEEVIEETPSEKSQGYYHRKPRFDKRKSFEEKKEPIVEYKRKPRVPDYR